MAVVDAPGVHGGPDASGSAPHDFSTNANACGPCPMALAAMQAADASRYPDPAYTALREQLAAFHGVERERIVVAASASEFIGRMTEAVAARSHGAVQVPLHSYADYARAARARGLVVRRPNDSTAGVPLRAAWACDPSSPLGQPEPGLAERVDALADGVALILDCAYEPLRLQGAPLLRPGQRDRVWQMWTPNKALGLTGVRAAYAIAPVAGAATLQARVERLAPSWPLGAHGTAMLDAWVDPATQAWLAQSLQTLRRWKAKQVASLSDLAGWRCLPSEANFFVAETATPVADMAPALRARGIKLRDCASFGLPGHVRLGVLPPASQQALVDALRHR